MLLYLSSNQNSGLFDFLVNEHGIPVKKLSGEFCLNKFVIRDMRNFNHYSFIVIDLRSLKDSENEIIDSIIAFMAMYDSRVIILAEGRSQDDELLMKLYNEGVHNIITAQTAEGLKEEILECISVDGMSHKRVLQLENIPSEELGSGACGTLIPQKGYFNCNGIKIAVAGVSGKVGTTTNGLNLSHYLADLGAKVSYLEVNKNGHINILSSFYKDIARNENFMEYKGVKYFSTKSRYNFSDFNFNILDIGELAPEYLEIFRKCDIRILCATAKPYELPALTKTLELIKNVQINCLFSFASERNRKDAREIVKGDNVMVYFARYSPDLFDDNANKAIWSNMLSEYAL